MSAPNFDPLDREEVIAEADRRLGDTTLTDWVAEQDAQREADRVAFEAAPFELAGVTVEPGDIANLTIKDPYGPKTHRRLNCEIIRQYVSKDYRGRHLMVEYRPFGGKPEASYARRASCYLHLVVGVAPVTERSAELRAAITESHENDARWGA